MSQESPKFEISAIITVIGVILLFSGAVIVTLIAPQYVDPSWKSPSSIYQVQMYEVSDPNTYFSSAVGNEPQIVNHLKNGYSLLVFQESATTKITSSPELEKYITRNGETTLKLTSRLMLLRPVQSADEKEEGDLESETLELYVPEKNEAFSLGQPEGILENWVEKDFTLIDPNPAVSYHQDQGVIYVLNPREYKVSSNAQTWNYNPLGAEITDTQMLQGPPFGFRSRKELIEVGETIYAIEGCWYCHTDQTRTLVQDVVLNGSDSYPAPPSSPNEYIYQRITFPGTKRNGPDLSRVGVKRPSRDWHKSHFWSPKTASPGSIMPSFRHFFDFDPRGTSRTTVGIPNYKFEAIFQYLMTKGTRITPPTEAWWLGKDPIQTKEIIEGKKVLK